MAEEIIKLIEYIINSPFVICTAVMYIIITLLCVGICLAIFFAICRDIKGHTRRRKR